MCNHYKHPNEWRELPCDLQGNFMLLASNQSEMWPGSYGPLACHREVVVSWRQRSGAAGFRA